MFKDNQVMSVSFMIAKENVLASSGIVIFPVYFSVFNCGKRRMFMVFKLDAQLFKKQVKFFLSPHQESVFLGMNVKSIPTSSAISIPPSLRSISSSS